MSAKDRREALRRLGAFAMLPIVASVFPLKASATRMVRNAPGGDFRLVRKVSRALVDGRLLVVERSWSFRFAPVDVGMRATSFAQSCTVDAPPGLEALARMEEAREDSGPFPARLDPGGQIVMAKAAPQGASPAAIAEALSILRNARLTPTDTMQAQRFLGELASAAGAAVSAIPVDLFFPVPGSQRDQRVIPLPGGGEGSVEVHLCSMARQETGLLDCMERTVSTRIGSDERTSSERWSLQRI